MNNPLVSVIMPTYGRPDFLIRATESVLAQDYVNYELIIVDDNNPDTEARKETEKVLDPYLKKYSDKLIYKKRDKNGGGSLARNDGIEIARGEYITFLDDDDEYFKNKISEQVHHIKENVLDLSLCGMQAVFNDKYIDTPFSYPKGETLEEFLVSGSTFTPMIMCKKALLNEINGFTQTPRFQDHLLMLKLLSKNPNVLILKKKLYIFNMHDGDRVTYSKKSMYALDLKHSEERKYINRLEEKEKKILMLRQSMEKSNVMGRAGYSEFKNLFKYLSCKFSFINNLRILSCFFKGWLSNYKFLVKIKNNFLN